MDNTPLVSIVISVYNHSKYIEECLRGILMQKVDFPYEVFVGDDHSPDGTADVLRRLRPEFPENFHFILREQNVGAVKNGEDLYSRANGKYLVDMEGDDFWTYDRKLQTQVDYLEAHPDCSVAYTHCVVVGEDSKPNGETYPQCPFETYTFKEFLYSRLPGQSGTLVCRRQQYLDARTTFMEMKHFGGKPIRMARNEVGYGQTLVEYAELYGSPEAIKTAKKTYYRVFLKWALDKRSSVQMSDFWAALKKEPKGKVGLFLSYAQWCVVLEARKLSGKAVDL